MSKERAPHSASSALPPLTGPASRLAVCAASSSRCSIHAAASDPFHDQLAAKAGAADGDGVGAAGLGGPAGVRTRLTEPSTWACAAIPAAATSTVCRLARNARSLSSNSALQTLRQSVPAIKQRIVVAVAACILANDHVTVREAELLRAICDTLDSPLPPLFATETEGSLIRKPI